MRRVTREEDSGSRGRQLDQLIDSLISAQPDSLAVRQGYSSVSKKRRLKSALLLSLAMTLALATFSGQFPCGALVAVSIRHPAQGVREALHW
jgi:hypothetical protein